MRGAASRYVALLRAVNVGGTGKSPMADLRALCTDAGFTRVETYIASGDVLFDSPAPAAGTARNLNTVRQLAKLCGGVSPGACQPASRPRDRS